MAAAVSKIDLSGRPFKRQLWLAMAVFIFAVASPHRTSQLVFRQIANPLNIHAKLTDPPRRAFENLFGPKGQLPAEDILKDWQKIEGRPGINLNYFLIDSHGLNTNKKLWQRRLVLEPLRFSSQLVAQHSELSEPKNQITGQINRTVNPDWIKELPMRQRDRLEAATNRNGSIAEVNSIAESDVKTFMTGQIRLSPGLVVGDQPIEVRHFLDGVPREVGRFNPVSGEFNILVDDPRGDIVAQIYNSRGQVVAAGTYRLPPPGTPIPKNPAIPVQPKGSFQANLVNFNHDPTRVASISQSSARGVEAHVMVASLGSEFKTDALGTFQYQGMSANSWALVRAQAKGFKEALFTLPANGTQNLALIPDRLLEVLAEISKSDQNLGLIWGQVLLDGKPIEGIQVSIESDPSAKPTYLSGFIPAEGAQQTFANGYFVFQNLNPGMYELVAKRGEQIIGHLNLQVDEDTISTGNIELTSQQLPVSVKVYDAFSGEPLSANLSLQSLPEELSIVGGASAITLPNLHRLSIGYAHPLSSEYVPAQLIYTDDQEYIHAPLVREAWLQNLAALAHVTPQLEAGNLIGFIQEENFEAFLPHESQFPAENIVYFDPQGNIVSKGVAGGGFVFFNVPAGTQSIVVLGEKSQTLNSQIVPVDPGSTTVLSLNFN